MLGFDRRAASCVWTAALVLLLLYVVFVLRKTLFVFVLSLLFAYLLHPLISFLDRLFPASRTRTRTPALALAYVIFVGVMVFAGIQIGARVVEQANSLTAQMPALLDKWQQPSQGASPAVNTVKAQILSAIQEQVRESAGHMLSSLPKAGMRALTIASDAIFVIIIPILAFFFLKDADSIRDDFLGAIDDSRRRALLMDVMDDVHLLLAHYMRALVILSVATFVAYGACFLIVGVPFTVLLAVMAALLEFIPMIGPLAAAAVITLVAALNGVSVWPILIFMGVYRLFQDYILSPHIMGHGVELHPLLVLFGVFAGAELAGIPGAFLSVPVLALARIIYRRFRKTRSKALVPETEL